MNPVRRALTRLALVLGSFLLISGCDAASQDLKKCLKLEQSKDPDAALVVCEAAVKKSPDSKSGKAAAAKIEELKAAIGAKFWAEVEANERARQAAEKAQIDEKERWRSMPKILKAKIRQQGMWDLGRGTATQAMDVIVAEIGQPKGTYEASYGAIHGHGWGSTLVGTLTIEDIKKAPFGVLISKGLMCGDYGGGEIEFYNFGNRVFP